MVDRLGDVLGPHGAIGWVFRVAVGRAIHLPPANPAPRQQHRLARRPMVPPRPVDSSRPGIANLRLAPHFAGHNDHGLIEQAAFGEIFQQRAQRSIEFGQQPVFQAVEVVPVRVPPATTLAERVEFLVRLVKHRDKWHSRLHQPAGQQERHPHDARPVPLPQWFGLLLQIERTLRSLRGEQ